MPTKKEKTYKESVERLDEILSQIENGEMDIDALTANVKEASELIKSCKEKLTTTSTAVEKLIQELEGK